ncbi:MBL fold metallo-hydrolase [Mesorhizobium sp. M0185]|uniref:MBL fold metallo-hydrolase n=1 Tax=Mesorhizobium sp. M0185 TaxID=2956907 RepID=UPI00333D54FE
MCCGNEYLLIDTGSGAVLEHLHELGVDRVDWVLHTHPHRDQCWGTPRSNSLAQKSLFQSTSDICSTTLRLFGRRDVFTTTTTASFIRWTKFTGPRCPRRL